MHAGQHAPPDATPIRCGAAASTAVELDEAIRLAADAAAAQVGGAADLAVVFVAASYGDSIRPAMEGLGDALGVPAVIAATAEAVLAADVEYESGPAVTVWMARMPGAVIVPFALEYEQTPDGGTFAGWPAALDGPWPDGAAVVLLADPFSFPVDAFIRRMEDDHPGVPIVGGMASGGYQPAANTLVVGQRTYDSGAVGFVIGGAARVRPVVSQGCRPIGRPLVVTKSEENVIVELGGRPALERLREIYVDLDQSDRELVRSSLHVGRVASEYQDSFQRGDFLVRNVVGADPESGVIAVGDLVRTGQTVQFHVRDAKTADEDLRALLEREKGGNAAGALVFTCNGRGTRLFDEASHDARCLREIIGPVPAAGFFAQGEIGPIGRRNCLHGFTASIALFEPRG
jgi:small ligand-binding sensory domain FIST